jgi:hypothetical protein
LNGVEGQERRLGWGILLGLWLWDGLRNQAGSLRLLESLAGSGESVALNVDKLLDPQGDLDIAAAIEPLASSTLVGFELGKLRLPKAQDIGLDFADARHITDLEVKAVGDRGLVKGAVFG